MGATSVLGVQSDDGVGFFPRSQSVA